MVNGIQIRLKAQCHAIYASWFVVDLNINDAPACDIMSRIVKSMVAGLKIYAAANALERFVQAFIVLETTPFLGSELTM